MTATRRREGSGGANPLGTGSAGLRGMLLIAFAVVLGVGLLAKSFGDSGPLELGTDSPSGQTGGDSDGTTGTDASDTTTTPPPTTHPRAEVKALVLNGSGKAGVAKQGKDILAGLGYTALDPKNAAQSGLLTTSVYFAPTFDADALAIAGELKVPASAAKPLPNPLPTELAVPDGLGDANVIVVVGLDASIAGGTPATDQTTTTTAATN